MRKLYILIFVFCTCFVSLSSGQSNKVKTNNIVKFFAFPNPVIQGKLTITTFNTIEKKVTIYNVLGKRVFTQKFSVNKKQLDLSHISSGIYVMKVIEGDKVATKKLIIK
jgi:hypothetical protein